MGPNAHPAENAARLVEEQRADLRSAQQGDSRAFERLVKPHTETLRALTYRLVGHPEDAADISQETLARAFQQVSTFRGEASFSTWLLAIATHLCLDHLRARGRWRVDAQPLAKDDCVAGASPLHGELFAAVSDPSFAFDVHEHIAFCFTCVARSLTPEMEIAIVLSELFDLGNREAAASVGVTESVFRHQLSSARKQMQDGFDGLCVLVSKTGACYQCKELRDLAPAPRRGPEPPSLGAPSDPTEERWRRRLTIVRDANLEGGASRALHDLLFRWISANATLPATAKES
jgi:RNA polymerase sigma-70 factor (ECF subfamily)